MPAQRIGHTAYGTFLIERDGVPLVRVASPELARIWSSAFEAHLAGDSIDQILRGGVDAAPDVVGN